MTLEFFTIKETARMLGTHERNVRDMIRNGLLKTVKVGEKVKVTKESIENVSPEYKTNPNPDLYRKKQIKLNPNVLSDVKRMFDKIRVIGRKKQG